MNTEQRTRVYFPAWHPFAKARGWVMAGGRLVGDLAEQRRQPIASPAREELLKVLDLAESFAGQEHRAVKADDLRHGCNHVASRGQTIHCEKMDNRALNQFVRLIALLADPENLTAVGDWLNPEEADRKDYARWLARTIHEGTLIAIAVNTWGSSDWEAQPMAQLRWLARTASRRNERRRGSFRRTVERDTENEPF